MKQVVFVKRNEEKWKKIESFIRGKTILEADELANHYLDITDELAYAKTFYPQSPLVHYLNQLASQLHGRIYRNKKEDRNRLLTYWTEEIPQAIARHQREMKWSLIAFLCAVLIGYFSAYQDLEFVRMILGDSYVNMTIENIEKGDPMAIYKGESQAGMFIGIGANNIRVSFLAFVMGILASLATGIILFSNGVMVGAFIYFFVSEGLFSLSFTTIMIHGTLELSAIVISGAAGFILGNSWMFPGTYSRTESLVSGARDAVKVIIGLIPVFVAAAFIESYVTRHYLLLGMLGRVIIIGGSACYIWWYFYFLPQKVKNTDQIIKFDKVKPVQAIEILAKNDEDE